MTAIFRTDGGTQPRAVSIKALFEDCTYFGQIESVQDIKKRCMSQGYIPFIDYDEEKQMWVWHSMMCPDFTMSKKQIASKFEANPETSPKTEKTVERAIAAHLRKNGAKVRCQVRCVMGIADIVTPDAIYEVEQTLTRQKIFEAVGQVLLYRACINPQAKAIIAGGSTSDLDVLRPYIASLGVEVMVWSNN